jgi:acyl-coenzyme A thioesterase PaaI-like protein
VCQGGALFTLADLAFAAAANARAVNKLSAEAAANAETVNEPANEAIANAGTASEPAVNNNSTEAIGKSNPRMTVSIQSDIRIFRSESEGLLWAEAREVFDHKRLSSCEVRITNAAGELVATFAATGYRKEVSLF